jgi:uncharacterized protein (TIGR02271 family)
MPSAKIPNTNLESGTRECVAGLFHDDSRAETAVDQLKSSGFSEAEIGVATANTSAQPQHSGFWSKVTGILGREEHAGSASELQGSLESCGIPDQQARYFNQALAEGDALVTVHAAGDRALLARRILASAGGDMGNTGATKTAEPMVQGERKIQLLGEILRVHKERVQRGEVRLRKEVVTENQHGEVPVSHEELVIERTPVQGRQPAGEVGTGEKEIRVPLSEEQVRLEKSPVVREEVRVAKKQVQDTKRIDDTVRHEELRTDKKGEAEIPNTLKNKKEERVA